MRGSRNFRQGGGGGGSVQVYLTEKRSDVFCGVLFMQRGSNGLIREINISKVPEGVQHFTEGGGGGGGGVHMQ